MLEHRERLKAPFEELATPPDQGPHGRSSMSPEPRKDVTEGIGEESSQKDVPAAIASSSPRSDKELNEPDRLGPANEPPRRRTTASASRGRRPSR